MRECRSGSEPRRYIKTPGEKPSNAEFARRPTQFEYVVENPIVVNPNPFGVQSQPYRVTKGRGPRFQVQHLEAASFGELSARDRLLKLDVGQHETPVVSIEIPGVSRTPIGNIS
jgi:hypothetical protein